jgi:Trk K+ transport system NAD-binding subunit
MIVSDLTHGERIVSFCEINCDISISTPHCWIRPIYRLTVAPDALARIARIKGVGIAVIPFYIRQ